MELTREQWEKRPEPGTHVWIIAYNLVGMSCPTEVVVDASHPRDKADTVRLRRLVPESRLLPDRVALREVWATQAAAERAFAEWSATKRLQAAAFRNHQGDYERVEQLLNRHREELALAVSFIREAHDEMTEAITQYLKLLGQQQPPSK